MLVPYLPKSDSHDMKWFIPAKTFLLGEYAAVLGHPAIVLTTTPCFELTLSNHSGLQGIHIDSPAGRFWDAHMVQEKGLKWHDPYQGHGGMGASSAQFLGAYLAMMSLQKQRMNKDHLLSTYIKYAWSGEGICPSGYDVLAQSSYGCIYIDGPGSFGHPFAWPFQELGFLLIHTGQKLATHHHLQAMTLPSQMDPLAAIVLEAKVAFENADSDSMIRTVNAYHLQLLHMGLVAKHSMKYLALLKEEQDVLAVKGCGAMGADILLLLVPKYRENLMYQRLSTKGWKVLATSEQLYQAELAKNNPDKRLEF